MYYNYLLLIATLSLADKSFHRSTCRRVSNLIKIRSGAVRKSADTLSTTPKSVVSSRLMSLANTNVNGGILLILEGGSSRCLCLTKILRHGEIERRNAAANLLEIIFVFRLADGNIELPSGPRLVRILAILDFNERGNVLHCNTLSVRTV